MNSSEILRRQFQWQLVNGPFGDPGLLVDLSRSGQKLLFDAGDLTSLSRRELLKIHAMFISHAHVDHFIGFDAVLRANIPHFRTFHVIGPKGMLPNVRGKISGYLWNLLDPCQVNIVVHEVWEDAIHVNYLTNANDFVPIPSNSPSFPQEFNSIWSVEDRIPRFRLHDESSVIPAILDHGTPSLAFKLEAPARWQVDATALVPLNLEPGPWISALQKLLIENEPKHVSNFEGTGFSSKELQDRCLKKFHPVSLGYATDFAFVQKNIDRLRRQWLDITHLICESSFADADRDRALRTAHLSTRQAALIARCLHARSLEPFHISGIYGSDGAKVVDECVKFFGEFRNCDEKHLIEIIRSELDRPTAVKPLVPNALPN